MPDAAFRATLLSAYVVHHALGKRLILALRLVEGRARAGDRVVIPLVDGGQLVREVLAVEFLNPPIEAVQKGIGTGHTALVVEESNPADIKLGGEIRLE